MIDAEPILQVWRWVWAELHEPEVLRVLAILTLVCALFGVVMFKLVPMLLNHHVEEVTEKLYRRYRYSFMSKGIQQSSLELIGRCLVWVFGLKLCAELFEPFVAIAAPITADRILMITRYDWGVLACLVLLMLTFWLRFLIGIRAYDNSKASMAKRERRLSRAHPMFWKPAFGLLLLLFLPDLGKRATSLAADVIKDTGLPALIAPAKAGE